MIRLIPLAAASVVAALAAAAAAIPPAPEVAVLIYSPWEGSEADSEALLAHVAPDHGGGWLRRAEPAFARSDFAACPTTGRELEDCIRGVLAERGAAELEGPPTVVVALGPAGPGFIRDWTCIGVGEGPSQPDRQRVGIDFMTVQATGMDPEPGVVQAAAGCITAAAAESGW